MKRNVTQKRLKELFDYDTFNGHLAWKVRQGTVSSGRVSGSLNTDGYYRTKVERYDDFSEAVCVRLASEQCLDWSECDKKSSAYNYVSEMVSEPIESVDAIGDNY